jgi:hypothetical protein
MTFKRTPLPSELQSAQTEQERAQAEDERKRAEACIEMMTAMTLSSLDFTLTQCGQLHLQAHEVRAKLRKIFLKEAGVSICSVLRLQKIVAAVASLIIVTRTFLRLRSVGKNADFIGPLPEDSTELQVHIHELKTLEQTILVCEKFADVDIKYLSHLLEVAPEAAIRVLEECNIPLVSSDFKKSIDIDCLKRRHGIPIS